MQKRYKFLIVKRILKKVEVEGSGESLEEARQDAYMAAGQCESWEVIEESVESVPVAFDKES